jgi:succinate dehydrogenase / fumarate reductase, flavoprotein subunit
MSEFCGVVRSEEGLREGLEKLAEIREAAKTVDVSPTSEGYGDLAHALDLRGSLVAAEATLLGAIERRETRGAHNRSDYPELDPELTVNFVVTMDSDGKLSMSREEVHPVPEYLQEWTRRADREEYRVPGRLVE